ncbi:Tetratricopeptide repeat (TPR)-like superfamily protein [Zea mays]|uniref:Tetratricopeptide repeat (TPR)-like superfamily protein n=1 Tax=Zea mays TaxID=4577 RepID=A0A1D6QAQ9_MAIZE|nr:Tetratricopeptide repeat (TPR)-like superfamily protein [Zea mays]
MALRRVASVLLRTRLRGPVTSPARKALVHPLQAPPRRQFSPRPPPPVPFAAAAAADAAEEAFEAARSTNDMLAAFSRLEATVPANDKRLALACLKLGQHLEASGSADTSRVLALALRCLGILEASPNASTPSSASDAVSLAMALHLAGSASFDLSRFHDALSFLSRALRLLAPLLPETGVAFEVGEEPGGFDVRPVAHAVRLQLANVKTALGRREEALADMRACLDLKESILPPGSRELGALANQEKAGDTKRCLEIACDILEKKKFATPDKVAEMYIEVSSLFETVNELEKAISLLKKSLGMLERMPQAQHLEGNVAARIGWLLLLTGKVSEAVPYLEDAVERMKDSFGPKHYGVGYPLAMEFQKRVIDSWRNHGADARDELKEAMRLYNQIKAKALACLSPGGSANALPESQEQETDSDTAKAAQR